MRVMVLEEVGGFTKREVLDVSRSNDTRETYYLNSCGQYMHLNNKDSCMFTLQHDGSYLLGKSIIDLYYSAKDRGWVETVDEFNNDYGEAIYKVTNNHIRFELVQPEPIEKIFED